MPLTVKDSPQSQDSCLLNYSLSVTAALIAEAVTYPLDLAKARLQIQGESRCQVPDAHGTARGPVSPLPHRGLLATFAGIVTEEGVRKLWRGLPPALCKHSIYSGCRMSFYEILRDKVRNPDGTFPLWKASLTGACAGSVAQLLASPAAVSYTHLTLPTTRSV